MKRILITMTALFSISTFADTIKLKGGESIYLNGTVVKCEGSLSGPVGNAQFADLPTSKLIILLKSGLGSCKIKYTSGSNPMPFYYSNRFNGVLVDTNNMGYIRDDIRNGNCE